MKLRYIAPAAAVALLLAGAGVASAQGQSAECTAAITATTSAKATLDARTQTLTGAAAANGIDAAAIAELRGILTDIPPATITRIQGVLADSEVGLVEKVALLSDPAVAAAIPRVLAVLPDNVGGDDVLAVVNLLRPVLDAQLALNKAVDAQTAACGDATGEEPTEGEETTDLVIPETAGGTSQVSVLPRGGIDTGW